MPNHCTQLKFTHPDEIAPGVTDWIEANPVLDCITNVTQLTTAEQVTGLQVSASQPNMRYVFNFIVFWTSKEVSEEGLHNE